MDDGSARVPGAARAVAERRGTPVWVYDAGVVRRRVARARAAFAPFSGELLYAVKANPCPALVAAVAAEVDGLDVASGGELGLAIDLGAGAISYAGPAKPDEGLARAIEVGATIAVESVAEIDRVAALAAGREVQVRLRVNPAERFTAFAVPIAGRPSPFGIDEEELEDAARRVLTRSSLRLDGLLVHAGSECGSARAFARVAEWALRTSAGLRDRLGVELRSIDLGGGFGVGGRELDVDELGQRLAPLLTGRSEQIVFELGRWLVAPAGVYVCRVVGRKRSRGVDFVIVDGGIHQHFAASGILDRGRAPRPPIVNLSRPDAPRERVTITGALCTPLDVLGADVELARPEVGDRLGWTRAGAYGLGWSPVHFLSHPPPAEVVLDGDVELAVSARASG